MPFYVITGVSKGLGWEFLRQISSVASNTVIGVVRNKPLTDQRVAKELNGRSNVHILEADITDYDAIKRVASETAAITGGKIDYLIANAAYLTFWDAFDGIGTLGSNPTELSEEFHKYIDTNVLAYIHLYNLLMPQILNGQSKKVVFITSGHADLEFVNNFDIEVAAIYSTSKAAMNMINAKYSAQYKGQGVLFLSISPGMVDVGSFQDVTPEQMSRLQGMLAKFKAYAPDFKGPITPEHSVKSMLSVVESCSVEAGHGGAFLSHLGTRQWL